MERYINPYTDFGFKKLFPKLFEQAEIARFTPQDVRDYEESVKIYRDLTNVVNTAERKGREEGREEERMATARRMKADGLPPEMIAKYTGLTIEAVQHL
jgi:predicted transposase/invertase (TIGR01784 family)